MTKPANTVRDLQKLLTDSDIGWYTANESGKVPKDISGGIEILYTEYTTISSDSFNCFGNGSITFFSNNGVIIGLGMFND